MTMGPQGPAAKPRLLFLITEDWYFWSHRLSVARAARDHGFDVVIATRISKHRRDIEAEGFSAIDIKLRRSGRNPFGELAAILDLIRIYRRVRPTIVHQVTIKPVLYGSIAAFFAFRPAVVNAVAGLGHVFVAVGLRARVRRWLVLCAYRLMVGVGRSQVIFQNPDDRDLFVHHRLVHPDRAHLIRGAGVDPTQFVATAEPPGDPVVMLAGRLLWTKGIGELVAAAAELRRRGVRCRVALVGVPDTENPMAIPESTLRQWRDEQGIEWWGHQDQMATVLQQAAIVALPTFYGEGVPKILLEAAACARPLVATRVPGCAEVVHHGVNGLLVEPRDSADLANALETLLRDPGLRAEMGRKGRELVCREFSQALVVDQTLAVYQRLVGSPIHSQTHTQAPA